VLLRTLLSVAFIIALGTCVVQSATGLVRARLLRAAQTAADHGAAAALAAIQTAGASAIAGGSDPRELRITPPSVAGCAAPDQANCPLHVTVSFENTTTKWAVGAVPGASCAPLCAVGMQENDAVAEGRLAERFRIRVIGSDGSVLAERDRYAVFRTFRAPPYLALAGTRDAGSDAIASGTSEGDDGGVPGSTTVNVRYVNGANAAAIDANVWSSRAWSDADARASDWDP
jgi:hypothetical protein